MAEAGLNKIDRRIGVHPPPQTSAGGSLLLVVGGMHGNEPAGVLAARRVLAELVRRDEPLDGRFVALVGNARALRDGQRFEARDLNRIWSEEEVARVRAADPAELHDESREQRELLDEIESHLEEGWDAVTVLDLHSTSADGSPFLIMGDTLQNRRVAFAIPVPVILGLEELVEGTLLSYFSERGHTAICLEGGQNDLPSTVDHHEAAIWLALVASGLLGAERVPRFEKLHALLAEAAGNLPRVVELRHRQPVSDDAWFHMVPGYANFHHVRRGEVLARIGTEESGVPVPDAPPPREVRTPVDGLLLMPRYQGQGDDAFFIGSEVRRVWLSVSAGLRRLRLEWLLPFLPGIRRKPGHRRRLCANDRIARWYVLEILHLFGYRRSSREGAQLEFVRRVDLL